MERKPWRNGGSHRAPFGGEGRPDRADRGERRPFGRDDRSDRREFGDRSDRREFGDRSGRREFGDRSDRREFGDRSDRREFGDRRRFDRDSRRSDRRHPGERRERFGVRSGPRARALETRRYADRSDFAKQGIVHLDPDVADYFENVEAVNSALRLLIQSSLLLKGKKQEAEPSEEPESAETAADDVTLDPFDDEDEECPAGEADADCGCDEAGSEAEKEPEPASK